MEWLRTLFGQLCPEDDVVARSLLTYSLLIGSYFIAGKHGDKTQSEAMHFAVDRLLPDPAT